MCVLCQEQTSDPLVCPARNKTEQRATGYQTLANNLQNFREIQYIPVNIVIDLLDEGNGIEKTLITHSESRALIIGQEQYATFVEERIDKCARALTDTIPKNKLSLFGNMNRQSTKGKSQVVSLQNDCNLFARMYIGCQARDGSLEEFFKHENQVCPPSLSSMGKLRIGQKSELLDCLYKHSSHENPAVDMKVLDGPVIVNMLTPNSRTKTFHDYATGIFLPYIIRQSNGVKRMDVVWDKYDANSLKQSAREARGQGIRRRISSKTTIPSNWKSFLRSDENKSELFAFLAEQIASLNIDGVQVISTKLEDVVSSTPVEKEGIAPCNHEEADSRIMLHVAQGAAQGHAKIMIKTVDTDIVVLATAYVVKLSIQELWVDFGVGKHTRCIPAHKIAQDLGPDTCEALPFFHSITGCDTVSAFAGRGKKTAFEAWRAYPDITTVFRTLSKTPTSVTEQQIKSLQRFVVLMYSRTSSLSSVNEARQALFAQGTRTIQNIPPTEAALIEHIKRAVYQGGHVWGQALVPIQLLPSPSDWGWEPSMQGWKPKWTVLPEASKACQELVHCGCKKACRGNCKCTKASLPCSALCMCGGNCHQE